MIIFIKGALLLPLLLIGSSVSPFSFSQQTRSRKPFLKAVPGADIEQEVESSQPQVVGRSVLYRGKVNEIDYCIAPADVSLSRAYDQSSKDYLNPTPKALSLTQALNNASNRAVRRILLARCWPSEEALNQSLRLAAAAEKQAQEEREASGSTAKCPVPRPILNLLMRKDGSSSPQMKGRTNEQYVADQIAAFRERYGNLPGYDYAEAYLESILSLATTGNESPRLKEVFESGIYDDSYKRVIAVLKSVGVVLEQLPGTDRYRIGNKLKDQDICLSMLDKLSIRRDISRGEDKNSSATASYTNGAPVEETEKDKADENDDLDGSKGKKIRLKFWKKGEGDRSEEKKSDKTDSKNSEDPLGVILLSAEEPTMTRQLNSISNIVLRALLFGGDQELLVLSETLETNKLPFVERWYLGTDAPSATMEEETRPGLQYLNALILLLRRAYDDGVVTNFEPSISLIPSYSNSYERLMASLVEFGSGYVRPVVTGTMLPMPKPRTAKEELGRFAVWESQFRSSGGETASYPEDLEGAWEVKDEVGGQTIGISTVIFEPQGQVVVAPPLQGLRWRLDPGPTHLDTCTFQVLGEDGTVLQYRGFIDRGARLEARFSKRATRIRGSVMFQMRDGDLAGMGEGYLRDMLPINYRTGTTKFVMTKKTTDEETSS